MTETSKLAAVIGAALLMGSGAAFGHGEPTCAGAGGIVNHGQHIVGDYVTGLGGIFGDGLTWPPEGQVGQTIAGSGAAIPGAPGPGGHFSVPGLPPGASFCNEQAHPNGFNTPDTRRNW